MRLAGSPNAKADATLRQPWTRLALTRPRFAFVRSPGRREGENREAEARLHDGQVKRLYLLLKPYHRWPLPSRSPAEGARLLAVARPLCVEINCMLSVLSTIDVREAAEASLRLPMYVCERERDACA